MKTGVVIVTHYRLGQEFLNALDLIVPEHPPIGVISVDPAQSVDSMRNAIRDAIRAADAGAGVLVLCGPAERDTAARIAAEANRPAVVSLADGPLSLGLTKAAVRRLALLVTTDSGPRHFAAAFEVPVVTLFGPTHIAWTETYYPKVVHLQKPVPCGPCQQRTCPLGHHRCMTGLMPTEVYAAADRLLRPAASSRELCHAS